MEKLLITGGFGFVGRELVKLTQNLFELHVVDNLLSGEHRQKNMRRENFTFHNVDLRNKESTDALIEKIQPDIVIHLAAIHFIPQCELEPDLACGTNILSTINLLNSINGSVKFIYTSSAAVYSPSNGPLVEGESKVGPVDIYGFSKLHGEHYVNLYADRYDLDTTIVRLFNVIGPGETNPHILPEIVFQLKNGSKVLNLGNIDSKRDFIDVRDVAEGFRRLIFNDLPKDDKSRVINLGSGLTYSMRDLLDRMSVISGIDFKIKKDPTKIRKIDNPIILASTKKLEHELDWRPVFPIEDTLKLTWEDEEPLSALFK